MAASRTVQFNVGGTIYTVSKSLLDQHPTTMLASIASARWNDENKADPIFVERNGERFKYVLDYMRDNGSVSLPLNVTVQSIVKELQFYGFEDVDGCDIRLDATCIHSALEAAENNSKRKSGEIIKKLCEDINIIADQMHRLTTLIDNHIRSTECTNEAANDISKRQGEIVRELDMDLKRMKEERDGLKARMKDAFRKIDLTQVCCDLAFVSFKKLLSAEGNHFNVVRKREEGLFRSLKLMVSLDKKNQEFNKHLSDYGYKCVNLNYWPNGPDYVEHYELRFARIDSKNE